MFFPVPGWDARRARLVDNSETIIRNLVAREKQSYGYRHNIYLLTIIIVLTNNVVQYHIRSYTYGIPTGMPTTRAFRTTHYFLDLDNNVVTVMTILGPEKKRFTR